MTKEDADKITALLTRAQDAMWMSSDEGERVRVEVAVEILAMFEDSRCICCED